MLDDDHSPRTSVEALAWLKRLGSVMSSANTTPGADEVAFGTGPLASRAGPVPLTNQVCHAPP
jgi:hypothetical protein